MNLHSISVLEVPIYRALRNFLWQFLAPIPKTKTYALNCLRNGSILYRGMLGDNTLLTLLSLFYIISSSFPNTLHQPKLHYLNLCVRIKFMQVKSFWKEDFLAVPCIILSFNITCMKGREAKRLRVYRTAVLLSLQWQ